MSRLFLGLCALALLTAADKPPPPRPPQKPIDCFAPKLTATEGIECLQRMTEKAHFEATLKALQR